MSLNIEQRPKSLLKMVGNESIRLNIENAIDKDTLDGFVILAGPSGTGKSTIAKNIALKANCLSDNKPCLQCENCKQMLDHLFLKNESVGEVYLIDMSNEGSKEKALEIKELLQYKKMSNYRKRIILIEEPQNLHSSAQDALLEILEYVPKDTHFIVCTTDLYKLRKAFRTRGLLYMLKAPTSNELVAYCEELCYANNIMNFTQSGLKLLCNYCNNTPRSVINLIENLSNNGGITVQNVQKTLGLIQTEKYIDFFDTFSGDIMETINFIDKLTNEDTHLATYIRGLKKFFYDAFMMKYGKVEGYTDSQYKTCKILLDKYTYTDFINIHLYMNELKTDGDDELNKGELLALAFKIKNNFESKSLTKEFEQLNSKGEMKHQKMINEELKNKNKISSSLQDEELKRTITKKEGLRIERG